MVERWAHVIRKQVLINDIGNGTKKTSNGIESEKSVDLCDKENKC